MYCELYSPSFFGSLQRAVLSRPLTISPSYKIRIISLITLFSNKFSLCTPCMITVGLLDHSRLGLFNQMVTTTLPSHPLLTTLQQNNLSLLYHQNQPVVQHLVFHLQRQFKPHLCCSRNFFFFSFCCHVYIAAHLNDVLLTYIIFIINLLFRATSYSPATSFPYTSLPIFPTLCIVNTIALLNTVRARLGSFKLFKSPFPGFLTILTL